jgi:hypothetical protein
MFVLHDLSKSICSTHLIVRLVLLPGQAVELDGYLGVCSLIPHLSLTLGMNWCNEILSVM